MIAEAALQQLRHTHPAPAPPSSLHATMTTTATQPLPPALHERDLLPPPPPPAERQPYGTGSFSGAHDERAREDDRAGLLASVHALDEQIDLERRTLSLSGQSSPSRSRSRSLSPPKSVSSKFAVKVPCSPLPSSCTLAVLSLICFVVTDPVLA